MSCQQYREDPTLSVAERDARRQVRRLRGFYRHLTVFVVVNFGLLAINLLTSPGIWWSVWPLAGWSVALVVHATAGQVRNRWLGRDWEERKVRELLAGRG